MNHQSTTAQVQDWLREHKFSEAAHHELKAYTGRDMLNLTDHTAREILGSFEGARLLYLMDPSPVPPFIGHKGDDDQKLTGKWAYQMGFNGASINKLVNYTWSELLDMKFPMRDDLLEEEMESSVLRLLIYIHSHETWQFCREFESPTLRCWLSYHGFPVEVLNMLREYKASQLSGFGVCELSQLLGPFNGLKLHLLMKGHNVSLDEALNPGETYADIWLRKNRFNNGAIYRLFQYNKRLSNLTRDELISLIGHTEGIRLYELVNPPHFLGILASAVGSIFTSLQEGHLKEE